MRNEFENRILSGIFNYGALIKEYILENDLELIIGSDLAQALSFPTSMINAALEGMGYERKLRQIDDENRVVWVEPKKNYWDGVYDGEIVGKPWSG